MELVNDVRGFMGHRRGKSTDSVVSAERPVAEGASEHQAPCIAILMGTFRGRRFLAEQMESIAAQTCSAWSVWASDDSSDDGTLEILTAFREKWGSHRLTIRTGPGRGFRANFLSLACDRLIDAHYFAFADQDDLWDPDKLARAIAWLESRPAGKPALYCARTRLIDEAGNALGHSPLFERPLTFANALVQSVAGANTMVFNRAARDLLCEAGDDVDVQTHDWWTYMVVMGCGGEVFYDPHSTVGYRQHGANLVGSNADWAARAVRARKLLAGRFRAMNQRNFLALRRLAHRLTPENRRVFEQFESARERWLIPRLIGVWRSGVYHHTRLGNFGLLAATLLKKL